MFSPESRSGAETQKKPGLLKRLGRRATGGSPTAKHRGAPAVPENSPENPGTLEQWIAAYNQAVTTGEEQQVLDVITASVDARGAERKAAPLSSEQAEKNLHDVLKSGASEFTLPQYMAVLDNALFREGKEPTKKYDKALESLSPVPKPETIEPISDERYAAAAGRKDNFGEVLEALDKGSVDLPKGATRVEKRPSEKPEGRTSALDGLDEEIAAARKRKSPEQNGKPPENLTAQERLARLQARIDARRKQDLSPGAKAELERREEALAYAEKDPELLKMLETRADLQRGLGRTTSPEDARNIRADIAKQSSAIEFRVLGKKTDLAPEDAQREAQAILGRLAGALQRIGITERSDRKAPEKKSEELLADLERRDRAHKYAETDSLLASFIERRKQLELALGKANNPDDMRKIQTQLLQTTAHIEMFVAAKEYDTNSPEYSKEVDAALSRMETRFEEFGLPLGVEVRRKAPAERQERSSDRKSSSPATRRGPAGKPDQPRKARTPAAAFKHGFDTSYQDSRRVRPTTPKAE